MRKTVMAMDVLEKKEKKVEYIELIYDLIFVYIVGRNNSLLHINGGFPDGGRFLAYVLCTLAVIQIWNFTTYYINIHGRNSLRDHVFLFVNMFLLYFIAEGTREHWQSFQTQYHVAWALILANIGLQYGLERRHYRGDLAHEALFRKIMTILFSEALLCLLAIGEYYLWQTSFLSAAAILFGMLSTLLFSGGRGAMHIDFAHLSERAMLYVVFTFGEMIIAIADYFEGDLTMANLYFSLMAFLIVVGLFLSYGIFYDRLLERERTSSGQGYMLIHLFLVFALNNITNGLEFMRNEAVSLLLKEIFLAASFLLYYVCLFVLGRYSKSVCLRRRLFGVWMAALGVLFAIALVFTRFHMSLNIAVTVLFIFLFVALLYQKSKALEEREGQEAATGTKEKEEEGLV